MLLGRFAWLGLLLLPAAAMGQRVSTQGALSRLEEGLNLRLGDGTLTLKDAAPVLIVSTAPAFEETKSWYPNAALSVLTRLFGSGNLRVCEACSAPRVFTSTGRVEENTGAPDVEELIRLDDTHRGDAAPARVAVWLDETRTGVSLRVVDLRDSRLLAAQNFDAELSEQGRTQQNVTLTQELERRRRGDALVHIFFDATLYPFQRVTLDFTEQWGDGNRNLSGVTLSLLDPVLGIGGCYYRVIPQLFNVTVGAQGLLSLPTGVVAALSHSNARLFDPLLTGAVLVRVPIGRTNYGVNLALSTNLKFGIGISLMNFSLLPFLP